MFINQEDNSFKKGLNKIVSEDSIEQNMFMDISVLLLEKGEEREISHLIKETAILLIKGCANLVLEGLEYLVERENFLTDFPYALHFSKSKNLKIKALDNSEFLILQAKNERDFNTVFYNKGNIKDKIFGKDIMQNKAIRLVRDIINFENSPYSNLVMGEVIIPPGSWSSYPPHYHMQPEVYFYKFDRKEGFGASFIGDDVYKIEDNSFALIPGNLTHPLVAAPGYALYFCWMIRHLENNPWRERIDDPKHSWLYERDAKIWEAHLWKRD